MKSIVIGANEEGQRLDRFLRKYLAAAPLSAIYKMIRKDIKVNGKRGKEDQILRGGDIVALYLSDMQLEEYREKPVKSGAKRTFGIVYEDDDVLVVDKPFGLLTHGDGKEKKNHLANQVLDYLIAEGAYNPRQEKTFVPASANRLDRNTTGLVIFGKSAAALRGLNAAMRSREGVQKYYLTIVSGVLTEELTLRDRMVKDEDRNLVSLVSEGGKEMVTRVIPVESKNGFTLVEVEILTGRTHQIRVQLAGAGFPLIGDSKYGDPKVNQKVKQITGLTTQLLHGYRLAIDDVNKVCGRDSLENQGKSRKMEFVATMPQAFYDTKEALWRWKEAK